MAHAPKVFISYAREDAGTANRLYRDLKAVGAEPWLDTESLLPGQNWPREVRKAIRGSDFFLALLSNTALGKRGYIQKEFREALAFLDEVPDGSVYLIPARLDDCHPEDERMEELHWVDLFPSYQSGFEKIVRVVGPPKRSSGAVTQPWVTNNEVDLARQGWGVVFPTGADHAIREALKPLLELRCKQASRLNERFYQEFSGETAYRPGSSYLDFLVQRGAGPGVPDPGRVPGYLLLVGGPETVPFELQYELGIQYRVGRLDFDTAEEYRNYAESLVSVETGEFRPGRRALLFGTQHPGDVSTQMVSQQLTAPLTDALRQAFSEWSILTVSGRNATKKEFLTLLGGDDRPDFLFLACHGMQFPPGHDLQFTDQGSVLCADWPGPGHSGLITRDYYVTGDEVSGLTDDLRGLQVISFSECGAGTPQIDEFTRPTERSGPFLRELAPRPFVSSLAKRLLGKPNGAAAMLAHVDRTWTYSFTWRGAGPQIQTFLSATASILSGQPMGLAHKIFALRYAELASRLYPKLAQYDASVVELQERWVANVDARNYIVIGDPAARIPV